MIEILDQEVGNITRMIWESMLGMGVESTPDVVCADPLRTEIGVIYIHGAWEGVVVLQAPIALAEVVAGKMFAGAPELTSDLIQDAWGEMTNMIGGNIKSLLPEPSVLSTPTTVVGENFEVRIPGGQLQYRQFFKCADIPLVINVFQRDSSDSTKRSWVGPGLR